MVNGYWTPNLFAVTIIWYDNGHQDQGHFEVKVIKEIFMFIVIYIQLNLF